jgi:hypothetical protein
MVGLVLTMPLRPNRLRCVERRRDITADDGRTAIPRRAAKPAGTSKIQSGRSAERFQPRAIKIEK